MRRVPSLVLMTLLTAGCASSGLTTGSDRQLEAEVRELQAKVLELQRSAAVSEVERTRLRQQVAELQARLGPRSSTAVEPAPIEPTPVPAPRPAEISESELEGETIDLFEEGGDEETEPQVKEDTTSVASPSVDDASAVAPLDAQAQALYDRGYTLYHQGEYLDAETSFRRFLEGNASSDLSDNAQFWIGECRLARDDLRGALAAFRETVNRYPEGNKVPDALLKTGEVLERLGDAEGARDSYREIQRRFPDSAAAVVASERLGRL